MMILEPCIRDRRRFMAYQKIRKPENPLRPIVSFYNTPLSALHKQLSNILKPITVSHLRLKNSEHFLDRFTNDISGTYPYFCSLDIKSLYTSCNMHSAVDIAVEQLKNNPQILPNNITPETIKSLLIFFAGQRLSGIQFTIPQPKCRWSNGIASYGILS